MLLLRYCYIGAVSICGVLKLSRDYRSDRSVANNLSAIFSFYILCTRYRRRIVRGHGKRTEKTYVLGRSAGNIISRVKTLTLRLAGFFPAARKIFLKHLNGYWKKYNTRGTWTRNVRLESKRNVRPSLHRRNVLNSHVTLVHNEILIHTHINNTIICTHRATHERDDNKTSIYGIILFTCGTSPSLPHALTATGRRACPHTRVCHY